MTKRHNLGWHILYPFSVFQPKRVLYTNKCVCVVYPGQDKYFIAGSQNLRLRVARNKTWKCRHQIRKVLTSQNEKLKFVLRAMRNCLFKAVMSSDPLYISERSMWFLFECWISGVKSEDEVASQKTLLIIGTRRQRSHNSGSVDGRHITNQIDIYKVVNRSL